MRDMDSEKENNQSIEKKLEDIIALAEMGGDEEWDKIDSELSTDNFCDDIIVLEWVTKKGLENEDGEVRDLAVSMLEQSRVTLTEKVKEKLRTMLVKDDNKYVCFRAACALFQHKDRSGDVIEKLRAFATDPDVKEVAESYLSQMNITEEQNE